MWYMDDAKRIATNALQGLLTCYPTEAISNLVNVKSPYPELGRDSGDAPVAAKSGAIIVTARFRSGSTLLWNLFRNIDGVTAFYEPFNERRWFDPESRGNRLDGTHRGISDYWREYDGFEDLGHYYNEDWTCRDLLMNAKFSNPPMKRYIELLIERAPGRAVLQFNRIDYRLPWIKHNFPYAKIVHLYRNPRDQWCSSLVDTKSFSKDEDMNGFSPHDHFYLTMWARDLKYQFPFLDERTVAHPYQLFYYIWKLSYLFGLKYAHYSFSFEDLIEQPKITLGKLFGELKFTKIDLEKSTRLIEYVGVNKWRQFADDSWFKQHEMVCETVLSEFLRPSRNCGNSRLL